MELRVLQTNDPQVIAEIGRLRADVWHAETPVVCHEFGDSNCWVDEHDTTALHWLVYDDGELVAAARLSLHEELKDVPYAYVFDRLGYSIPGPVASINRLVVKKSHRGKGIGRTLDQARMRKAKDLGAVAIVAMPVGPSRERALERLGYVPIAVDINPSLLDVAVSNATISVMAAPLPALSALGAPAFAKAMGAGEMLESHEGL